VRTLERTASGWYLQAGQYRTRRPPANLRQGVWWTNAERWAMLAALQLGYPLAWVARRHQRGTNGVAQELGLLTFGGRLTVEEARRVYAALRMLAPCGRERVADIAAADWLLRQLK
jgi:hypothetical protein